MTRLYLRRPLKRLEGPQPLTGDRVSCSHRWEYDAVFAQLVKCDPSFWGSPRKSRTNELNNPMVALVIILAASAIGLFSVVFLLFRYVLHT